jgi:hypothetical protein
VECELSALWTLPDAPIPEPTELAPPTELSDMLLWVSRLFSWACERVTVEKTDRSAVDVTLVSANDRLDPVWSQSNSELASSMLGSNENFEPATGYNNKTTRERAPREHVSGYDDVVLVDGLYILNALD